MTDIDAQQTLDAAIARNLEDLYADPTLVRDLQADLFSLTARYGTDYGPATEYWRVLETLIMETLTVPFSPDLIAHRAEIYVRQIGTIMALAQRAAGEDHSRRHDHDRC